MQRIQVPPGMSMAAAADLLAGRPAVQALPDVKIDALLDRASGYWKAGYGENTAETQKNLGTAGSALDLDTNGPAFLPHTGVDYLSLPGSAGNHATYTRTVLSSCTTWRRAVRVRLSTVAGIQYLAGWESTYGALYLFGKAVVVQMNRDSDLALMFGSYTISALAADTDVWLEGALNTSTGVTEIRYSFTDTNDYDSVVWTTAAGSTSANTGAPDLTYSTTPLLGTVSTGSAGFVGRLYADVEHVDGVRQHDIVVNDRTATAADMSTITADGETITVARTAAPTAQATLVTRPAWRFGVDGYLECADNAVFTIPDGGEFTALVAYRHQAAQQAAATVVASHRPSAGGAGWSLRSRSATDVTALVVDDGVATDTDNGAASSVGRTHVVTGRVTATTVEARLDGVSAATTSRTAAAVNYAGVLRIGTPSDAVTNEFSGEVFLVAVFADSDEHLTTDELTLLESLLDAGT